MTTTIATSQNDWPVLQPGSTTLHTWVIPARNGHVRITLRNGSAGFLLAHFLLWFAETIEPLAGKVADDWGHAVRAIRGQLTGFSNHASGTAADHNATKHPLGVRGTFKRWQVARIKLRLVLYRGCIRSGIFYVNRPDEMHEEINRDLAACERVARRLCRTPRGRRILHANPGQRAIIFS
jgi:hypothetical protein